MKEHARAGLKNGLRIAKYATLAHTLLIPLIVAYCYFTGTAPSDNEGAPSERQLFIACLIGAMSFGTILLTALHDLGRETKNRKYWPMLGFYASLMFALMEGARSVVEVEFNALIMTLAFFLVQIDDCLTARGWSTSIPEPKRKSDPEVLTSRDENELMLEMDATATELDRDITEAQETENPKREPPRSPTHDELL